MVAPVALLEQWKDEIETKCTRGFFKVLIVRRVCYAGRS